MYPTVADTHTHTHPHQRGIHTSEGWANKINNRSNTSPEGQNVDRDHLEVSDGNWCCSCLLLKWMLFCFKWLTILEVKRMLTSSPSYFCSLCGRVSKLTSFSRMKE